MGFILWIASGAIVGWLASAIMGLRGGSDVIIGIVGAIIGGFVMGLFGQGGISDFTLYGFIGAVLGACVLIAIVKVVRK